ncbi:MAG: terpene cyclase/mutase family protein [Chlamydiota bacterium]|nr:terpene cyclase/mutase family protein [Chlamydiota bacterium]
MNAIRLGMKMITLIACFFISSLAGAQDSSIEKSVQWLISKQNSDGSWGQASKQFESTFEVVRALSDVVPDSPAIKSAVTWIKSQPINNNLFLSRKIAALSFLEGINDGWLDQLIRAQSRDGGWGYKPGYSSNVFDTLYAFNAFRSLHDFYFEKHLYGAIERYWLMLKKSTDAFQFLLNNVYFTPLSFWSSVPGADTDLVLSARVIESISSYHNISHTEQDRQKLHNTQMQFAVFLDTQIQGNGSIQSSLYQSMLCYIALLRAQNETDTGEKLLQYILALRDVDGSWEQDPFLTALGLQCLKGYENQKNSHIKNIVLMLNNVVTNEFRAFEQFEIVIAVEAEHEFEAYWNITIEDSHGVQYPILYSYDKTQERFYWQTKEMDPGPYTVKAELFDAYTGIKYDNAEKPFTILPSASVNIIRAYCDPSMIAGPLELNVGVEYRLIVDVKSNTSMSLQYDYRFTDPQGTMLSSGDDQTTIVKGEKREILSLASQSITFALYGQYALEVSAYQEEEFVDSKTGYLSFTASLPIVVTKTLQPDAVPAVKGTRVKAQIKLQSGQ